jgi:hypothetical protein
MNEWMNEWAAHLVTPIVSHRGGDGISVTEMMVPSCSSSWKNTHENLK